MKLFRVFAAIFLLWLMIILTFIQILCGVEEEKKKEEVEKDA